MCRVDQIFSVHSRMSLAMFFSMNYCTKSLFGLRKRPRLLHVVFTRSHMHVEKAEKLIGLAVKSVRKDTKRLLTLLGSILLGIKAQCDSLMSGRP